MQLIMVDPDIPRPTPQELLHWMQTGLVSANTSTNVAGRQIFALEAPENTPAIAAYIAPSPPALNPVTHRYIQLLLNTTGNEAAVSSLRMAGSGSRTPFDAEEVINAAGLRVLAGNWFNVTNTSSTKSTASGSSGIQPSQTGVPFTGGVTINTASSAAALSIGLGAMMVLAL